MLSNPSPESSVGKFLSARNSMASRSRIVLVYSARFKRRAVTRPGSGFMLASARANSVSRNFTSVVDLLVGPKHVLGRHLLRLELRQNRLPPVAIGGERLHGRVEAHVEPAGEVGGVVTLAAGLFEQRLGGRGKRRGARRMSGSAAGLPLAPGPRCALRPPARRCAAARRRCLPRRSLWRRRRLPGRFDVHRQNERARRDSNGKGVTSHSCAPRPRLGPWRRRGGNHGGIQTDDPLFLRRVHDHIPMLAIRPWSKPRSAIVEHADRARVRQLEVAVVGMDRIEHRRQRGRRRVVRHRLQGAVGVDDRMRGRPREVLLDARAGIRQRVSDFRSDGDDRRRPLGKELPCGGHVALDRRLRRPGRKRSGGDDQLLALRRDLRPRPIQAEDPDDAGGRAREHDGRVAIVLGEQQVADEDRALRRVDEAADRAGVERRPVSGLLRQQRARGLACRPRARRPPACRSCPR